MKGDIPFTDYDFWAYLSVGFVLLFAVDHAAQTGLMIRQSWTLVEGFFVTACAYAAGHLLAGLASAIFERRIVRGWLGAPSVTLMGTRRGPNWFRRLYPSFYESLPEQTRDAILAKSRASGVTEPGEALFFVASGAVRSNDATTKRLSNFLNLYGWCRNLSFTALLCAAILAGAGWWTHRPDDYWWAVASLVLSLGMFLRYLKFYRHYSLEIYTGYAHSL